MTWRIPGALVATTALGLLAGCGNHYPSVSAPQVGADLARPIKVSKPATIGVIYSPAAASEGGETYGPGSGALVAAYRLGKAGVKVTLKAESDQGTDEGSSKAVAALKSDGVSGIVDVSIGAHVAAAAAAASKAGIPILFPYEDGTDLAAGLKDVWLTGPSRAQQLAVVRDALANLGTGSVAVLASPTVPADVVAATDGGTAYPVAALGSTTTVIPAADVKANPGRPVLVWGNASTSAGLVAKVEQLAVAGNVPTIVLSAAALSPTFASSLQRAAEETSGRATPNAAFEAAGELVSDISGGPMSGFLLGVRALAADPTALALNGTDSFAGAGDGADADTRSYDAVVALANAAARGGSPSGMRLTQANGLIGGPLDFGHEAALASSSVGILRSTSRSTGLRPLGAAPLTWFLAKP